uniref:Putative secreted protein n=1 Tax=Anopheles darlingi TaxID=43151 RepID=A0A2M4DQA1_ANODA
MLPVRKKQCVFMAVLLLAVCCGIVLAGDENDNKQSPTTLATETTNTTSSPTTPAWMPYMVAGDTSANTSILCKTCTCSKDTATFDCTEVKLNSTTSFPSEAWQSLNATGLMAKTIIMKSTESGTCA